MEDSISPQFEKRLSLSQQGNGSPAPSPFAESDVQALAEPDDFVGRASFGAATNPGGRPYQDDRATAFSARLPDGSRITVAAVLDGHHGHHVAELIAAELPGAFLAALAAWPADMESALAATVRRLDDVAYEAHASGRLPTGGTTVIVHVITGSCIYTANVGDCKTLLSSRGAPEALSEAHNPPVESEKRRFSAAGVPCFSDHIGGSDINVCRTVGDYDLGPPLKWRDPGGAPQGPLISEPEITVRQLDPIDEFLVVASDGLWDYFTPETSVVTEARRRLRSTQNDPQAVAEWLVTEALLRQRGTLHSGTPGDNVTVMVIQLRRLPEIPRTSASRLNLRRAPSGDGTGGGGGSSFEGLRTLATPTP